MPRKRCHDRTLGNDGTGDAGRNVGKFVAKFLKINFQRRALSVLLAAFSNIRIMVNEFLDNLYFRLVIIKETKKTSEGIT